jgi:adenosylcobinamide-GDP ribazoletransferase
MNGLISATAFLTRAPLPKGTGSSLLIGKALPWFPVVGAAIGALVGAVVYAGLVIGVPGYVAAAVAVAVSLLVTGALHEDGLADTFDGIGSGRRGDDAIEIMRDPRIGTFGAAALLVSLLLQIVALGSLNQSTVIRAAVAAYAASRGFAALALHLRLASGTGLATGYTNAARPGSRIIGFIGGVTIAVVALPDHWWVLAAALGTGGLMAWWAQRRIGGITGDVIGAIQQVTLVTILVGATIQ